MLPRRFGFWFEDAPFRAFAQPETSADRAELVYGMIRAKLLTTSQFSSTKLSLNGAE